MIIQIRGTSGSGKSTVMRGVLQKLGKLLPHYVAKRKKPICYTTKNGGLILGHYESPCGGCDTIGGGRAVFDLIKKLDHLQPKWILCEGLLLSEDVKWTSQLPDVRIVFLTTPTDTCISRIKDRRLAAGNQKPLRESNTRNRVKTIERARTRLTECGVTCLRASNNQAEKLIKEWISNVESV